MTHFRSIKLTRKDTEEFQRIYLKVYGEEIEYDDAQREALRFLRFMSVVMN